MARRTISTALDTDGELYEQFTEFEERYDTRAEAVRAALRQGVETEGDEGDGAEDDGGGLEYPSSIKGWSLFALGFLSAATRSSVVLAVLLAGTVLWSVGGAALAYPAVVVSGAWLLTRTVLPAVVKRVADGRDDVDAGARAFRGAD